MLASRPARAFAVAALALASATCAPPLQSGGVYVVADGVAERLGALCRWRGEAGKDGLCPADAPAVAPAKVRRLGADPRDRLSGPLAVGRAGDYLLENDQIAVVIDQLGPGAGFAESGGNIVDAADAAVRRDELGQVFTYFGVFPRQALYDRLETGVEPDGTAWVEVRGRELHEPALLVTTRYTLRPGDRALLLTTALENTGREPVRELELGDVIQWGSAEKIAPGREPGFRGDCEGPFLAGVGAAAAYALVPVEAAEVAAKNGGSWSNVSFAGGVAIAPGKRATYARVLAVASRGDPLGVVTELFVLGGGAPGGLAVELTDARGAALGSVEGRVTLAPVNAQGARAPAQGELALWLRSDGRGEVLGGEIPPGRYVVGFEGSGRRAVATATAQVQAGAVSTVRLALSDAGRLRVAVREVDAGNASSAGSAGRATPAKVSMFHADTGKPAGPPRLTTTGDLEMQMTPGRYRVVASRGPEMSLAEATLEVPAAGAVAAELRISRVVDTAGYLACDLHQHTALSGDAGVAIADRVLSNAAEGVECAVASEHNLIVDWTPTVQALGLAARFRAIAGDEITSDASRQPFGHLNVFPLQPDPKAPRGGAPSPRDRTAREAIDAALALPGGERVVQVNHPRSGSNGYFDLLGFDPATGAGKAPGYDDRFDAVEVWSGRHVEGRARVLEDVWGLLRAGRPVTPTANTDTHGIVGAEPGYPRTYLGAGTDDPARLDGAMLVEALRRRRDVVLTNGPFVTMRVGDVRQGGLASPGRGAALTVRIERAPWVDARELQILVGGAPGPTFPLAGAVITPAGALLDEVTIPLATGRAAPARSAGKGRPAPIAIPADTFVVAVVRGERPLDPVLAGPPDEIRPFAMTAPLWIDADGDGRALGR